MKSMFKITDHIEFDPKGRASCPVCQSEKGKSNKNLALVPNTDGAYKCHRGCSAEDIRQAIGQPKEQIVPSAIAKTKPISYHSKAEIEANTQKLLTQSTHAKKWLNDRLIGEWLISRHRIGITNKEVRKYEGKKLIQTKLLPHITVPYEYPQGYLQKYFVAPWLSSDDRLDNRLSQDSGLTCRFWFTKQGSNTDLFIMEGEWDAILMSGLCQEDCCTLTTGCGNVPKDLSEIADYENIYIWYDLDQPGQDGAIKLAKAIGSRAKIATVPHRENCNSGWDTTDSILNGFNYTDFAKARDNAKSVEIETTSGKNKLSDRLITTRQLLERAPDFVEFLVHDLITANELQVLAAPPRAGKSLLALSLVNAVAGGHEFMGRPTQQGTVIYVNVEDGDAKLKERVVAQGWDTNTPVYWLTEFSLNEWDQLLAIANQLQPKLIVIDTLTSVRDDDGDENSSKIANLLKPLKQAAKLNNYAVLLVHHTKKLNANLLADVDVFETMRGSGTIRSECRGALVLAEVTNRDSNRNEWRLIAENGSYAKQDLIVLLDAHNLTWNTLSNWTPNCSESQESQALAFFDKVGSATIQQLAANTSIPSKSAYTVATRLVQRGMLVKQGSRQNAFYSRPIQQIQLLDSLLNSSNPDTESDRANDSTKQKNTFSIVETSENNYTFAVENNPIYESVELDAKTQTQQATQELNKQFNKPESVEFKVGDFVCISNVKALAEQDYKFSQKRAADLYKIIDIEPDRVCVESQDYCYPKSKLPFLKWVDPAFLAKIEPIRKMAKS